MEKKEMESRKSLLEKNFTEKDLNDIKKDLQEYSENLIQAHSDMNDADKDAVISAMEYALYELKAENKELYNPRKNQGK